MSILQKNQDLTQSELAVKLGMSVRGLSCCLNALIRMVFVKMGNFHKTKNKFKYVYLLAPLHIVEKMALTSRYFKRKMEEHAAIKLDTEALKKLVEDCKYGPRKQAQ